MRRGRGHKRQDCRFPGGGRLQDSATQKIDAHNTSFWAASTRGDKDGAPLGLLERQRVKYWLQKAYDQVDSVEF